MKILVTGANGLVGRNFIPYAREKGHEVVGTTRTKFSNQEGILYRDCDLTNFYKTAELLMDIDPDVIVHLAANSSGRAPDVGRWKVFEDNVQSVMNIAEYCRHSSQDSHMKKYKVPYFVFASSIVIYDDMSKSMPDIHSKIQPKSLYGVTKASAEMLLDSYSRELLGDFKYTSVRLPAVVGPGLTHGVVKIFIDRLKNEEKFWALGPEPGSVKPYVHTEDVCEALLGCCLINEREDGKYIKRINISNNPISIEAVAKNCMSGLGIIKDIEWRDENWSTDNTYLHAARNNFLESVIGYEQKLSSEMAILKAAQENA